MKPREHRRGRCLRRACQTTNADHWQRSKQSRRASKHYSAAKSWPIHILHSAQNAHQQVASHSLPTQRHADPTGCQRTCFQWCLLCLYHPAMYTTVATFNTSELTAREQLLMSVLKIQKQAGTKSRWHTSCTYSTSNSYLVVVLCALVVL